MATSEKTSSYRWVIEVLLVLALASQARGCPWAHFVGDGRRYFVDEGGAQLWIVVQKLYGFLFPL
jgi:hypothetical protein